MTQVIPQTLLTDRAAESHTAVNINQLDKPTFCFDKSVCKCIYVNVDFSLSLFNSPNRLTLTFPKKMLRFSF